MVLDQIFDKPPAFLPGRPWKWGDNLSDDFTWGPSGSMPKPALAMFKRNREESTETESLTKGCAGNAVAAAASRKAPQAVVKDFKPSKVLSTHRPCLAAVE